MNVIFSSGVWEEVSEADEYYENEVEGLGRAFVQTVFDSIQEIKRFPEASRRIRGPYRRYLTPRFPYGVLYRIEGETIYVVAVAHLKRRPFYWKDREAGA